MLIALLQAFILAETDILPYFYWPIDFIEVIHLSVKEHFFFWNADVKCATWKGMSMHAEHESLSRALCGHIPQV